MIDSKLLLRALSERIPYQTAIEPLDGSPAGILKCTDWEGHVWITGHDEPYDVEEVRPLLRKYEDLSRQEVTDILSEVIGPDITTGPGPEHWYITEDGQPICEDSQYSLFFAPEIIDIYLDSLRSRWVDTQGLIDKKLAVRVTNLNNPYRLEFQEKDTITSVTYGPESWMVLPPLK